MKPERSSFKFTETQRQSLEEGTPFGGSIAIGNMNYSIIDIIVQPKSIILKAEESDNSFQPYAIKLIPAASPSAEQAGLSSNLIKPLSGYTRFVKLYRTGHFTLSIDGETIPFMGFVYEWVNGHSLRAYLDEYPDQLTPFFLRWVVAELCRVRLSLRAHGLVHDDLHANNIMIIPENELTISDPYELKVIDLSAVRLNPLEESDAYSHSKIQDEHGYFVEVISEVHNAIMKRRSLSHSDRRFLTRVVALLEHMLTADPSQARRDVSDVLNYVETAFAASLVTSRAQPQGLDWPFEILSGERIPDDKLLLDSFADSCPWLAKVASKRPCLLTGPRGCGKTTLFRWLSLKVQAAGGVEAIEKLKFSAFFLSCATELQNRFYRLNTDKKAAKVRQHLLHYFNLLLFREIVSTMEFIDTRRDQTLKAALGINEALGIRLSEQSKELGLSDIYNFKGVSVYSTLREATERALRSTSTAIRLGMPLDYATDESFLSTLTKAMSDACQFFKTHPIAFLVDDYSVHRVPLSVQRILNPIIWERSSTHFFKLSSEKYGVDFGLTAELSADNTREFIEIDCGREYIQLHSRRKSHVAKRFAEQLLDKRLALSGYAGSAKQLIGNSSWKGGLAEVLVDKNRRKTGTWDAYHGLSCIAMLCSGDVSTLMQVYEEILTEAKVDKTTTTLIKPSIQHSAITKVSKKNLEALRYCLPYGRALFEIANQYGHLVARILNEGKWVRNREGARPSQAPRIEVDYEGLDPISALNDDTADLMKELIRRAVFIELDSGKSRRSNRSTLRLHFRRILLPHFSASLYKNVAIKIKKEDIGWLSSFLRVPERTCRDAFQSFEQRSESPTLFSNDVPGEKI